MAESFSIKAILSAKDSGFTSTLKEALGTTESLASKIKDGFAFGVLTEVGQQAFSAVTSSAKDLISEIDSSNAAWKTFDANMKMVLGDGEEAAASIETAKESMKDYATQTVYSASDMATTYSQLAAVGIKNVDKLVTGFGGLCFLFEHSKFHILLHTVFFTVEIIVEATVTCIGNRIYRISMICVVKLFHQRLKTIHI